MPRLTKRHIIIASVILFAVIIGVFLAQYSNPKPSTTTFASDKTEVSITERNITHHKDLTGSDSAIIAKEIKDTLNKIASYTQEIVLQDTSTIEMPSSADIIKASTQKLNAKQDSNKNHLLDTLVELEVSEWEQTVEQDELIETIVFTLQDSLNYSKVDSISSKLADIRLKKPTKYYVQFWKTPLNSKGYKFTNYKIILFGVEPDSNLILEKKSDDLILHANGEVWILSPNYEFTSLVKYDTNASDK